MVRRWSSFPVVHETEQSLRGPSRRADFPVRRHGRAGRQHPPEHRRETSRRTAQPRVVHEPAGGPSRSRPVAHGPQPQKATWRPEVDDPGGVRCRARRYGLRGGPGGAAWCVSGRGYAPPSDTPRGLFPYSPMSTGTKMGRGHGLMQSFAERREQLFTP